MEAGQHLQVHWMPHIIWQEGPGGLRSTGQGNTEMHACVLFHPLLPIVAKHTLNHSSCNVCPWQHAWKATQSAVSGGWVDFALWNVSKTERMATPWPLALKDTKQLG